jgi:hypothetical protein
MVPWVKTTTLGIGEDTLEQLEQVKKGKPRKFVMICKGPTVVSLVVFKKGSFEKYKKQAKEGGKGQIYFGVVNGDGMEIIFQLARADGFDKQPVKGPVLKSFLVDNGGFKCRPEIEIIDALTLVLDAEDPLVQRFLALRDEVMKACTTHPQSAEQLNTLCRQIGDHFDQDQSEAAKTKLPLLETLLASLRGSSPQSGSGENVGSETSTGTTPTDVKSKAEQDWLAAYAKLSVLVAEVQKAGLGDVGKIRAVWAYALEKAEAGDFANALKAVPGLVQLLKTAREATKTSAETEIPFNVVPFVRARQQWNQTRMKLREELTKLADKIERALEKAVEKLEEEEDDEYIVESDVEDLFDYIENLDDSLEKTLEKLVETPDGNQRDVLKSEARRIVADYREVLDRPFFRDVDEGNGFTKVAVNSTADKALGDIEAALSA